MSKSVPARTFSGTNRPQAVVLAGGKGTRLRPIVSDRPKPMAEVGGRPFVEWLLLMLHASGIRDIVMCIGYMGEAVRAYFGEGEHLGLHIIYSEDRELGTGGAVRRALPLIQSDPIVVLNGDSYCEVDLATFLAWHRARRAGGSVVLTYAHDTGRYGQVQTNNDGLIVRFEEKADSTDPGWINAGVYLLSRQLIASIPSGTSASIERDVFPRWAGQGLYGYPGGGRFVDIGTPQSYAQASLFFSLDGDQPTDERPHRMVSRSSAGFRRYVLLDRDGTLNYEGHYFLDPDPVKLLPGVVEGLRHLRDLGLGLIVVTNEPAISPGCLDLTHLNAIHSRLRMLLTQDGVELDGIYFCPHKPEENCGCRKPALGLVQRAARDLEFDPKEAFVIGDKACDIELGKRVGAVTILITTGYGIETVADAQVQPDFVVDRMSGAAQVIKHLLIGDNNRLLSSRV